MLANKLFGSLYFGKRECQKETFKEIRIFGALSLSVLAAQKVREMLHLLANSFCAFMLRRFLTIRIMSEFCLKLVQKYLC